MSKFNKSVAWKKEVFCEDLEKYLQFRPGPSLMVLFKSYGAL